MGISNIILKAENISKTFKEGSNNELVIFGDSSFSIEKGQAVACVGSSGCGKTTLLQMCGLLDLPTAGKIFINDVETTSLNEKKRTIVRRDNIGFVYQMHNLFPEFTALENVMMPAIIKKNKKSKKDAEFLLDRLGILSKKNSMPSELSGGEKQRVAIARALINKPNLILADEPTGNLDDNNSHNVMNLLLQLIKEFDLTIFMVTHNKDLSLMCDSILTINNKKVEYLSK